MKWLVAMVLIAVAHARVLDPPNTLQDMVSSMICTPGSTFEIKCNTCFCTSSGMNYGCTKMACLDWDDYDRPEYDDNELLNYRKREVKYENSRRKRAADDMFADDQQFFIDEDPAPLSFEQQKELARQSYLQQQQDYYDQLRLQQDLAREKEELEHQQDEMQSQLEFQQEQDAQQWEQDAQQQAFERQQLLLEQQQQLIEQQQQQKQDAQYYKKVRNYPRKNALKSVYPQ